MPVGVYKRKPKYGNKWGYSHIHAWIIRTYGKANKCENKYCKYPKVDSQYRVLLKPKRFEWALKKGKKYEKNKKNFFMLCSSCHHKYDGTNMHPKSVYIKQSKRCKFRKLKGYQIINIKKRIKNGELQKHVAKYYKVSSTTIKDIINGYKYRYINKL